MVSLYGMYGVYGTPALTVQMAAVTAILLPTLAVCCTLYTCMFTFTPAGGC